MRTTAPAPTPDADRAEDWAPPDPSTTGDDPRTTGDPDLARWRGVRARIRALFDEAWQRARHRRRAITAVVAVSAAVLAVSVTGVLSQAPAAGPAAPEQVVVDTRIVPVPAPLGQNGVVAATGTPAGSRTSDIYLVDPAVPVPRQLTSTPGVNEYAPAWSSDGRRLAFIRADRPPGPGNAASCRELCDLVVVDPGLDRQLLSVDIADVAPMPLGSSMVPTSIEWAPDGFAVVIDLSSCGTGGCGGNGSAGSVVVDVSAGRALATPPGFTVTGWSPDGRWLTLLDSHGVDSLDWHVPSAYLVPAGHLDAETFTDPSNREDWVLLSDDAQHGVDVTWMPDARSVVIGEVVSIGTPAPLTVVNLDDGSRRTLVADGAAPLLSPDGRLVAYVTGYEVNSPDGEILTDVWVVNVDGTHPRRVARHAEVTGWSPDGRQLVAQDDLTWFAVDADGTNRTDLAVLTAEGHLPWGHGSASWQRLPAG